MAFLEAIFAIPTPGEIVLRSRVRKAIGNKPAVVEFRPPYSSTSLPKACDTAGIVIETIEASKENPRQRTLDAYFHPGRCHAKKPNGRIDLSNASVVEVGVAWADIDPPGDVRNTEDDIQKYRENVMFPRVRKQSPQPSIIVETGRGLQLYWLLTEAVPASRGEAINKALAELFNADTSGTNPARMMRLPGAAYYHEHRAYAPTKVVRVHSFIGDCLSEAKRYHPDSLPCVKERVARTPPNIPGLFDAVMEHAKNATRQRDSERGDFVSLSCPFHHPDNKPSARVYGGGWFHCFACKPTSSNSRHYSVALRQWAKRKPVQSWGQLRFLKNRGPREHRTLQDGVIGAPRVAQTVAGPLLQKNIPEAALRAVMSRSPDNVQWSLFRDDGPPYDFTCPAELHRAIALTGGVQLFRVFWANIALAQDQNMYWSTMAVTGGNYFYSAKDIAYWMGVKEPSRRLLSDINRAQRVLCDVFVSIRWAKNLDAVTAHLITMISKEGRRYLCAQHPAIWRQLIGKSKAWFPWHRDALRLRGDALALYMDGQWQRSNWEHDRKSPHLTCSILDLSKSNGLNITSTRRLRDTTRLLEGIEKDLAGCPAGLGDLGMRIDPYAEGREVVFTEPRLCSLEAGHRARIERIPALPPKRPLRPLPPRTPPP